MSGRVLRLRRRPHRIDPATLVWIFGSPRTGSTWLSTMMGELEGCVVWQEPLVGALFGNFYYGRAPHRQQAPGRHFIMGAAYRQDWLASIRGLVLDGAERFPDARRGYLVIKEPNGSVGAPLLMEALPESRMIFLIRDPRDVVASSLAARRDGSWRQRARAANATPGSSPGEKGLDALLRVDPEAFARKRARRYLEVVGNAKLAYDAHEGRKVLVRYEELRVDTLEVMRRLYSGLGISVAEDALARAVEKHCWERIPAQEKGDEKFFRKATPGGWREDLTPTQAAIVEQVTAPLFHELYPESGR